MDTRNLVMTLCAFVFIGGVLFMLSFITYLVIHGAMRKPDSQNDAGARAQGLRRE
jgi:hypothetical protein